MKNKQKGLITPLIIAVIILFIIGGGIYIYVNKKSTEISPVACTMEAKLCSDGSYVGRTEPNCEFASCPSDEGKAEFGKSVIIHINEEAVFPDGLILILKEVNDSRCPANVQCIWQGELSALFSVNIQNSPEEIHLGTVNNKEIIFKNYTFSLKNATENTATVVVSKN
jgi:hypothetical protein